MTADEFRRIAMQLPLALESAHGNHPDFRIGGKVFASLGAPDEEWGMVKLPPERQQTYIDEAPDLFKPCSGAWGQRGYTSVHLPSGTNRLVRRALEEAGANIQVKSKPRAKKST